MAERLWHDPTDSFCRVLAMVMKTLIASRQKFRAFRACIAAMVALSTSLASSAATSQANMQSAASDSIAQYADGRRDATGAIQALIDSGARNGGLVNLPKGNYLVDAGRGIQLRSGTRLVLDPAARLIASPQRNGSYAVVKIYGVQNASIDGGMIVGERVRHLGKGGEWGMGIDVRGSSSIRITNITISDCWGDGLYIGGWKGAPSTNITLDHVSAVRNRRQGLSITSGDGVQVSNSKFLSTSGTDPSAGIDLEPNKGEKVLNVTIQNSEIRSNAGYGIQISNGSSKIRIIDNTIQESRLSGIYVGDVVDTVEVSGNVISNNTQADLLVRNRATNLKVGRNTFTPSH